MASGGMSEARLSRLRSVLDAHVARGSAPGLVWLVSRHGETHAEALGATEPDGGVPIQRDTIFRIASMTKPVTAVATMILVEECVLRLDDPVDHWLPELADRRVLRALDSPLTDTVPAHRPITTRDLLTFRMGFGLVFGSPDEYPILAAANEAQIGMGPPTPGITPEPDEWIKRLGALPLMYQPGERWLYNTGADVLGVLISRASGQPFGDLLRERIFEPLGMTDTGFSVPAEQLDRFEPAYWINYLTGRHEVYDPVDGAWSRPPAFPSGAAGLVSTAGDFLAFGQMLLSGGGYDGERILSRASVELMTTDQLTPEQKRISGMMPGDFDASGWGFGLSMVTRRDDFPSIGRYGWSGGLGSVWHNDPAQDMVTILLSNQAFASPHPPELCRDFWTGVYQAIDE